MNETKKYSITGHMVVKNEDRWIWFSIMSVIDYLDKLIIFDTGSRDKTQAIIKDIIDSNNEYRKKIIYKEYDNVDPENFYELREKQIKMTNSEYFMVVDGDEIWWRKGLNELNDILNSKNPELVATRFTNCCGDIYHYRYDYRETYNVAGLKGNITIRVYSMKIEGISCAGEYGKEGFVNREGRMVQECNLRTEIMQTPYFHTTLLNRSSLQLGDYSVIYRKNKLHTHWDAKFESDFRFPEVFYLNTPRYVKNPFKKDLNLLHNVYNIIHITKSMIQKKK